MNRRNFFRTSAGAGMLLGPVGRAVAAQETVVPEWEKPLFDLHKSFTSPVKIASIELLRAGSSYFVRTRSTDGATGVIETKDIADYVPILLRRVIPAYLGKDARDLETLVDGCEIAEVKEMIHTHAELTGSLLAYRVLSNWDETLPHFVRVIPKDYKRMLQAFQEVETAGLSGDEAVMAAFELNIHDAVRVSGN